MVKLILKALLAFVYSLTVPDSIPLGFRPLTVLLIKFSLLVTTVLKSLIPVEAVLGMSPTGTVKNWSGKDGQAGGRRRMLQGERGRNPHLGEHRFWN